LTTNVIYLIRHILLEEVLQNCKVKVMIRVRIGK